MAEIINNFGHVAGWNQHEVVLMGRTLVGISKIAYSDEQEVEPVYGAGKYPIGTGEGNYKAECSMTLLKEEVEGLLASLPDGMRLQDIPATDVPVLTIRNGRVTKDVIRNFRFVGLGKEVNQNDKSVYLDMPCFCTHIDWDVR